MNMWKVVNIENTKDWRVRVMMKVRLIQMTIEEGRLMPPALVISTESSHLAIRNTPPATTSFRPKFPKSTPLDLLLVNPKLKEKLSWRNMNSTHSNFLQNLQIQQPVRVSMFLNGSLGRVENSVCQNPPMEFQSSDI